MRILVDGDACPVKAELILLAKKYHLEILIYIDVNHFLEDDYAKIIYCDQGSDSVDLMLLNKSKVNDLIITQDYGLACLGISKKLSVFNFFGEEFNNNNIDSLLFSRYVNARDRKNGRYTTIKPRTIKDNENFYLKLDCFIKNILEDKE
jgi:Uncharacterized protein conserved in bacteria